MKQKPEIVLVAGARPNFMKIAPLWRALKKEKRIQTYLVHTGQHYDSQMSKSHFLDLGLPTPDALLHVGSGTHAEQTALVMERFEQILLKRKPKMVVVVGDVNSTLAAAITARKLNIPVAHVEAGLRSFDWEMPEEINRVVADHVSDLLFTYAKEANQNLKKEGIHPSKIHFTGNVMIDSLDDVLPKTRNLSLLSAEPYGVITLHRPSNVDSPKTLKNLFKAFEQISKKLPLYFPIHPRTEKRMRGIIQLSKSSQITFLEPLSYIDMISALSKATLVLTDSGGIQEETTVLGVPCLTLRENTERMVTVREGTNKIVGVNPTVIVQTAMKVLRQKFRPRRPKHWDGKASARISKILIKHVL